MLIPHFFTLSIFSTATPREASSAVIDRLLLLWWMLDPGINSGSVSSIESVAYTQRQKRHLERGDWYFLWQSLTTDRNTSRSNILLVYPVWLWTNTTVWQGRKLHVERGDWGQWVNMLIPGNCSAWLAIRLAADWLGGMLTPLDFMCRSEMRMVRTESEVG